MLCRLHYVFMSNGWDKRVCGTQHMLATKNKQEIKKKCYFGHIYVWIHPLNNHATKK